MEPISFASVILREVHHIRSDHQSAFCTRADMLLPAVIGKLLLCQMCDLQMDMKHCSPIGGHQARILDPGQIIGGLMFFSALHLLDSA